MHEKYCSHLKGIPRQVTINLKEFPFKNFKQSQNFVNKIADIAEAENHHPDLTFGWGYCKVKIYTHAIKGLAESDFILAAKIDKI